jgi:hypothetical protein
MREEYMYKYDFALSFAGKHRDKAEHLAGLLKCERARVFYDLDEQADLWGRDLYQHFQKVYGEQARFFIPFVSKEFVDGRWPKHELKQAQARDFKADTEYILPIRLDDTALPGLNVTTGYLDLRNLSLEKVAELCLKKLAKDSAIRRLYLFLRESNPALEKLLNQQPSKLLLRVALSKANELTQLLAAVDQHAASGQDHHNTLINGGSGPPGHIATIDPEPHTTFALQLNSGFYREIVSLP